jgi:16S rRNA (guanine1207-N2)-methyltransferase
MSDMPRTTRALLHVLSRATARPMLDVASHLGAVARAAGCPYVHNDLTACDGARLAGVEAVHHTDLLPEGTYATICFDAREYDPLLAAETVAQAAARLAPGGALITTARRADVEPFFASVAVEAAGQDEVLVARRPLPAAVVLPQFYTYDVAFAGQTYTVQTAPGIFSPRGLDEGTRLMLGQVEARSGARFLDLGCGAGIVSRIAAEAWGCEVTAVDVSARALRMTALNAPAARLIASSGFQHLGAEQFDIIASNPPYHTDFAVARAFIEGARQHLAPGGLLYLVVKRSDWYVRKVRDLFGGCRLVEEQGYTLIIAEKRESRAAPATAPSATTRKHAKRMAAAKHRRPH